jgi:nitroimidazol reductase NimA-like FMN-containing flavoprotein (pyridoxamine 5'-phosphate oxidase superfamily)
MHRAPGFAQGTGLHLLPWRGFIPEKDAGAEFISERTLSVENERRLGALGTTATQRAEVAEPVMIGDVAFKEIRRKDRALSRDDAFALLRQSEYGVLSLAGPDNQPYGVPLNFCVLDDAVYFHSAVQGHKLENIAANSRVSFCVVGDTEVMPASFGTRYASAIVFGIAEEVFDADKHRGLVALLSKYSAGFMDEGRKYVEKMAPRVRVFRIRIERITGKARR